MDERRRAARGRCGSAQLWRDESGKSSIRGLIALAMMVALVYAGYKFIPVRTAAYRFNDTIRDEVVYAGSRRTNDDQVMKNLLDEATILGLPIQRDDIEITRSGRRYIIIEASYTVVVELVGGYTYDWNFHHRHEGPVF